MTDEAPRFLTIDDVAELINVPKNTLYWWRRLGEGPPARKLRNGRLVYDRDDVVAWMRAQPFAAAA